MNELDLIRVVAQITTWQREGLRRVRERMAAEQKGEAFYADQSEFGVSCFLPLDGVGKDR